MKYSLGSVVLLAGLVGCDGQRERDPTHAAVTAYLTQRFSNYAPLRWCPPEAWMRSDSLLRLVAPIEHGGELTAQELRYVRQAHASAAYRDATPIGTWITHTYWIQPAQGSRFLDSTQFVVYPTGKVQLLDSLSAALVKR